MSRRAMLSFVVFYTIVLLVVIAGGLLTLKNIRLGRGDRRGAFRLAHFVFWVSVIRSVFGPGTHHIPVPGEHMIIFTTVAGALLIATFF